MVFVRLTLLWKILRLFILTGLFYCIWTGYYVHSLAFCDSCFSLFYVCLTNRLLKKMNESAHSPLQQRLLDFWSFVLVFWFIILSDEINHQSPHQHQPLIQADWLDLLGFWTVLVILDTLHCHSPVVWFRLLSLHSVKVLPRSASTAVHVINPRELRDLLLKSCFFFVHLRLSATRCSPVTNLN